MASKGISPMIAVVLLVAFTVAVGGIISLWMTNYATETTGSVETASENQTKCAGTYPKILSVSSNAILVTNPGSESIVGGACYSNNGNSLGSLTTPLTAGSTSSISWTRGDNTSVICTGTCRNIGISGECKSTYSCWK